MEKPDERLFAQDLLSAEFRISSEKGHWGLPDSAVLPADLGWPNVIFWIAAAARPDAPDRYFVLLNAAGYRSDSPTGTFWDPETKAILEFSKRPKGNAGSRVAMVFRTDWNNGTAFYHPYDRVAAKGHSDWPSKYPHLIWTAQHTIVDFLQEIHGLLNSGDYVGNR